MATQKPNRVFRLDELDRPDYRALLYELDEMVGCEEISYLHPSKRWEYPWALEQANLQLDSRILDVGCGASIFPLFLAGHGYETFAIDRFIPHGLDALHQVSVRYIRGDLGTLPLGDNSFDTLFCLSVLEHLNPSNLKKALAELRRTLKVGGSLLVTTDFYRDAGADLVYQGPGQPFRVDWNIFDETRLSREILNAPGFRVKGGLDLTVDWEEVSPEMVRFHGYAYTSVGVHLLKT